MKHTHSKKHNKNIDQKEQICMEEMNLYIDEVLKFYNKKLLKLKNEVQKIEKAIKTFEKMKRGEK